MMHHPSLENSSPPAAYIGVYWGKSTGRYWRWPRCSGFVGTLHKCACSLSSSHSLLAPYSVDTLRWHFHHSSPSHQDAISPENSFPSDHHSASSSTWSQTIHHKHFSRSHELKMSLDVQMSPPVSANGSLVCLYNPQRKTKGIIVDIIAVHGFHLVTEKPWTAPDQGTMWLSDLLTRDYPDARVLSYSYEVKAVFTGNWEVFESAVTDLVSQIASARKQVPPARPLVFVCRELGSLIVGAVRDFMTTH